jgi:hypothetical protein
MKCLYYLAPTLDSTHHIFDELRTVGISNGLLHVISRDEAGLATQRIPSSNYLETLDLLRDGFIGSAVGLIVGLIGAGLLKVYAPFGPGVPNIVYFATVAAATLFGAWEGGLTGIACENKKLAEFHRDIEAGRYLVLIYAPKEREATVRWMVHARHPEAEFAAIDRHFLNPFSPVKRRGSTPRRGRIKSWH